MSNNNSFSSRLKKILASVCSLVIGGSGVSQAANSIIKGFNSVKSYKDLDEQTNSFLKRYEKYKDDDKIFDSMLCSADESGITYGDSKCGTLVRAVRSGDDVKFKVGCCQLVGENMQVADDSLVDWFKISLKTFAKLSGNFVLAHNADKLIGKDLNLGSKNFALLFGLDDDDLSKIFSNVALGNGYVNSGKGYFYIDGEFMLCCIANVLGDPDIFMSVLNQKTDEFLNNIRELASSVGVKLDDFSTDVGIDCDALIDEVSKKYNEASAMEDKEAGVTLGMASPVKSVLGEKYKDGEKFIDNFKKLVNAYKDSRDKTSELEGNKGKLKKILDEWRNKSNWGKYVGGGVLGFLIGSAGIGVANSTGVVNLPGGVKRVNKPRKPKHINKIFNPKHVKAPRRNSGRRTK